MESINNFFSAMAWPVVILIIFLSIRNQLILLLRNLKITSLSNRNYKFKFGELQFESNQSNMQDIQDQLLKIAMEESPEKRLKMANLDIFYEDILSLSSNKKLKAQLIELHNKSFNNAAILNYYGVFSNENVDHNAIVMLQKMGLIEFVMTDPSDELVLITQKAIEIIEKMSD